MLLVLLEVQQVCEVLKVFLPLVILQEGSAGGLPAGPAGPPCGGRPGAPTPPPW